MIFPRSLADKSLRLSLNRSNLAVRFRFADFDVFDPLTAIRQLLDSVCEKIFCSFLGGKENQKNTGICVKIMKFICI
jgi:hypothetical protein